MKSQEEIENKIKAMKEGLTLYVENWNCDVKINGFNGLPLQITQDVNYNIIKNQIEALEWVLKDK